MLRLAAREPSAERKDFLSILIPLCFTTDFPLSFHRFSLVPGNGRRIDGFLDPAHRNTKAVLCDVHTHGLAVRGHAG